MTTLECRLPFSMFRIYGTWEIIQWRIWCTNVFCVCRSPCPVISRPYPENIGDYNLEAEVQLCSVLHSTVESSADMRLFPFYFLPEEVVKSTSLSLCPCYVCVIVLNQNCKLCKLFLHMPSTEFAHAQLRVNRVCTCSVKGKHDTKPWFLGWK